MADSEQMEEEHKVDQRKVNCLKILQKTVYLLTLLVLLLLLFVQTAQCIHKYFQGPTYISTDIVDQSKAGFPALTICPESNGYKEQVLQEHGIESVKRYNWKVDLNWSSNQTNVTESQLFDVATYDLDEIVKRFYIRFFKAHPVTKKTSMELDLTDPEGNPAIQEQRHRGFGRCYTIQPDQTIQNLGLYYYKMDFHINVKVYFHGRGQFLDLSGRMGYKIYLGETSQSQVSWQDIRMMSKETDDGSMSCIDSNYDECMYGALIKHMESKTPSENGCTVPWLINGTSGVTDICTTQPNINTTFWEAWNRVTNQLNDCPVPCKTLLVNLGAKNHKIEENSFGRFYLYFAPRTMVSRELLLYTPLSLFAEIGGYVGLLLGVSIWNFAAWISNILESKINKMEMKYKVTNIRPESSL